MYHLVYVQYIQNEYLLENYIFLLMTNKLEKKDIQEVISEMRLSKHDVIYRLISNKYKYIHMKNVI